MPQPVEYVLSLKDLFSSKLKQANDGVNQFESHVGRAQSALQSFGAAIGIAFGAAAVVAFGKKMIEAGSKVENAVTGMTTLLKDGAEAQQVIKNTMDDAMKTPFAFEGLLAANKALIGAGVGSKQAREDVLNLANAIAATGGGDDELQRMVVNLQQIKNAGKATALDIKQFAYAGVNIYKVIADATNQPISKVREMEVSYDMLTYALKRAHDQGGIYAGGLEKMANNTSVQISNLGDGIFQLSVRMFNDLKPAITSVISGLSSFIGKIGAAWDWIIRNKEEIKNWAMVIGAVVVPLVAASVATWAMTLAAGALAVALTGVATVMTFIAANPITVALAAVAGAVVYCYTHFAKFRAVLWGVWETVKTFGQIVGDIFTGLWHTIHGVFTLSPSEIKLGSAEMVNAMASAGQKLGSAFKKGYDDGLKDFAASQTTSKAPTNTTAKSAASKAPMPPEAKSETAKVQGQKVMNVTVNINGGLVKELKVQTTNIQEGAGKVREIIAETLLGALRDAQAIGG